MQKLLFLLGLGVLFALPSKAQTSSSVVSPPQKDTEVNVQEERRNAYQQQSISATTSRKDQILQEYGSFEAAEAAGVLVKQPLTIGADQKATETTPTTVVAAPEKKKE